MLSVLGCALQQLIFTCSHISVARVRRGALPWAGCPSGQRLKFQQQLFFFFFFFFFTVCLDENTIVMHYWENIWRMFVANVTASLFYHQHVSLMIEV